MSLGISLKSAEGIVLAADSRVTLMGSLPSSTPGQAFLLPSTFDNATKLLSLKGYKHVGALTFGAGSIGVREPRTAHSFLPEFEDSLAESYAPNTKLSVEEFAKKLGEFFAQQWKSAKMPENPPDADNMVFHVGGYDDGAPYGRLFELKVPNAPVPREIFDGQFGAMWGGQREFTDRLVQGFDAGLPGALQDILGTSVMQNHPNLLQELGQRFNVRIPWQFLPLQDCVDLAVFLIRTTITIQQWVIGVRGVGGPIDVATITRTNGFQGIQIKQITCEKSPLS